MVSARKSGGASGCGSSWASSSSSPPTSSAASCRRPGRTSAPWAIAVIRTFLNYFLEHDLENAEKAGRSSPRADRAGLTAALEHAPALRDDRLAPAADQKGATHDLQRERHHSRSA